MQLSRFADALRNDLATVAELGDEETAEAARRIALSIQGTLSMRLLEVLGEAAVELNAQLQDGRIEVRLVGQDPELVYIREEEPQSAPVGGDEAFSARITLRLPEGLKRSIEGAAEHEGVSVNSWLVRALARAVHGPGRRSGKRLTGFAES
jgi:HicB family